MASFLAQLIRCRWAHWGALGVVLLSFWLPPDRGFGVPLCQFREVTHLPCLACGLTRSYIAVAHLNPAKAAFYHPLGLLLFPCTVMIALLLLVRTEQRQRLAERIEAYQRPFGRLGAGLLVVFVVYGLGRMGWLLVTHRPSPW